MRSYVALLRGINVGGKNILPMRELVTLLEGLGSRQVKTYIQSGNAVFQHREKKSSQLSSGIRSELKKRHGIEADVLLLGPKEIEDAIARNPFRDGESKPQSLHVAFLAFVPANPDLQGLESLRRESERFLLHENLFYLHAPEGVARSKLAARAERLLGVSMTARNWRTVCKIGSMLKELDR